MDDRGGWSSTHQPCSFAMPLIPAPAGYPHAGTTCPPCDTQLAIGLIVWDMAHAAAMLCMSQIKIDGDIVYRCRVMWGAMNDVYASSLTQRGGGCSSQGAHSATRRRAAP